MDDTLVLEIAMKAILICAKLAAPILVTTLAVGFAISLFQSVTQIQEVTLTFVPKLAAVAVVLVVSGNWMLHEIVSFTTALYDGIPQLIENL